MLVERDAQMADLGFINSCLMYGARKGHYAFDAENREVVRAMKSEAKSVVTQHLLSDQRRAIASVFTLQNIRVGMLIMCEAAPGSMAYEIYALSVAKEHQHKGFGSQITDHVIRSFLYHDVIARCLPVSATMKHMLAAGGFVFYAEDNGFDVYLKHAFECSDVSPALASAYC